MAKSLPLTFVTGNQNKADYLAKYLGVAIDHRKLDLDEIQSLNLHTVVEHKVRQAYGQLQSPVLVEDVSLEFNALGRLPGTFIRFFVDELSFEDICRLLDGKARGATARCTFAYFDGAELILFDGAMRGRIADHPAGENGFGWDKIFIPEGYDITRAQMDEENDRHTYLQIKPFGKVKAYIDTLKLSQT